MVAAGASISEELEIVRGGGDGEQVSSVESLKGGLFFLALMAGKWEHQHQLA